MPPGGGWGPTYGYGPPQATEGKAVWALVLGILSLVCLGLLAGIPGIIVSVSARRSIRESQGRLGGSGMATAGLVLSIIGTAISLLVILLIIIGAVASHSSSPTSSSAALLGGATSLA